MNKTAKEITKELQEIEKQYLKVNELLDKFNDKYFNENYKYWLSCVSGDGVILTIEKNNYISEIIGIEDVVKTLLEVSK